MAICRKFVNPVKLVNRLEANCPRGVRPVQIASAATPLLTDIEVRNGWSGVA